MNHDSKDFGQLLNQADMGSGPAMQQLHDMVHPQVHLAARRRLPRVLRGKFDSTDFAQDAWLTYWQKYRDKYSFQHVGAFGSFLARIAECLVVNAIRQHMQTAKHNVNREEPLHLPNEKKPRDFPDPHSTPSQAIMREDQWRHFLNRQPPVFRRILILHNRGKRTRHIAKEMGMSQRTVNRVLANKLKEFMAEATKMEDVLPNAQ